MADGRDLDDLVDRLVQRSRLTRPEAIQVVDEVFGFLNETPGQFARRRHRELQREGHANPEIYARIAAEVALRRFRAAALTERQVRRMIYG
jgi:polyhydroxyalkanoate synthesis regulator phasin